MKATHRSTALLIAAALVLSTLPALAADGKVNINTATAEQLSYLPRVGPTVAKRILEYREKNGRFKAPAELMLVRGIGEKTFELLEPYVSVSGETTLTEKVPTPAAAEDDD